MNAGSFAIAIAMLLGATSAAARLSGAPASTLTTGSDRPAMPPRHRHPVNALREAEAARLRNIAPRPPLNIDCTPERERAARSDLERAQYRLRCGG